MLQYQLSNNGGIVLSYLLILPFCLQQDLVVVRAFTDATLVAHRHFVLPAVINQRLFMAITQQHGSCPFASPHERLSTGGAGAVCSLGQDRQGHITLENGPGLKLLFAEWAMRSDVRLALGVPVSGDAFLTEGVTAGDGYRDPETLQAYGADQVWILRLHL